MKKNKIKKLKASKRVSAKARCASFDIEMTATLTGYGGLSNEEISRVQRKLRHAITKTVAGLPFAHVFPHEVRVR